MARLMERLQKVDNDSPTESTTPSQVERNCSTAAKNSNKEPEKTEDKSSKEKSSKEKSSKEVEPKGLVRKPSGSLKLERKSKNSNKPKSKLSRHSSLGILPSSLPMGGGGFYFDDSNFQELAKKRKEAAKANRAGTNFEIGAFVRYSMFFEKKQLLFVV